MALPTAVVNVMRRERYDVYIGRPHPMIPREHWGDWGNPFQMDKPGQKRDGTREEVVAKYREWLFKKLKEEPELWERIHIQLGGKVLGCWCAPLACHGDVLAEVADQGLKISKREAAKA